MGFEMSKVYIVRNTEIQRLYDVVAFNRFGGTVEIIAQAVEFEHAQTLHGEWACIDTVENAPSIDNEESELFTFKD